MSAIEIIGWIMIGLGSLVVLLDFLIELPEPRKIRNHSMPYKIVKQGSKFAIVKKDTGKTVGHSDTKAKAKASIRARYAGEKRK